MQGEVIKFDTAEQQGTIRTETGEEYTFDLTGWRGRGLPDSGLLVSFEAKAEQAYQVFNLPSGQMKAAAYKKVDETEIRPVQTSFWSIMAIGTAAMSVPMGYFVALLGLLFALMGFREARLQPERYKGKGLALAAGALALAVLILTLLVNPEQQ
ncbi:hypothetical protein SAMN02745127_00263 [Oceanospirillum multiglobuliferum]|uniref:DUF4190 domain-containing protein n=1 Tax=Oceanospirillum multiglobuliferum TaxID=64969 RepID=A0A1T4KWM1_9GAMM|nr:hypothetical protein [Oceanospirillum multiglobuliferum]OPX54981.1 hypothetical protein BTE48_11625 [Oceanospirillum multiglobuliferum]SJZ46763.1 hypothetical protein SAMN02745127_00263 [Oceanospirillum multiglobuliferum]